MGLDKEPSNLSGDFYRSIIVLSWLREADGFGYLILPTRQGVVANVVDSGTLMHQERYQLHAEEAARSR